MINRSVRFCATTLIAFAAAGLVRAALPSSADQPADAPKSPSDTGEPKLVFTQKIPDTELSFDMVLIPKGTFVMGSPADEKKRDADEGPQIEVAVDAFYMGKYEVTWDLYNEFLQQSMILRHQPREQPPVEKLADAISYPSPIYDIEAGPMLQRMGGRQGKLPAVFMSPLAAKQFTKWLSAKTGRFYRLPAEVEWEYAARGGTKTAYFFGSDPKKLDDYAWYYDNAELEDGEVGYRAVGKLKPNPFGLYDIYGNVAEIVVDQYMSAYQSLDARVHDWRQLIRWPDKRYPRIVRGGGYESDPQDCRSAARQKVTVQIDRKEPEAPKPPWWWYDGSSIGFRLVSPVKPPDVAEQHRFWDVDSDEVREILKRDREIRQLVNEVRPKP